MTSTFTLRGRCGVGRAWRLRRWAGSGRARLGLAIAAAVGMAGMALGDIDLHFAWQVWHFATWAFTCRGRCGTYGTGLALVARLGLACAAAVCVAGVALGDIDLHFAWQVWHLATWTFTLHGRRGTYSTGLALVARLGLAGTAAVCVAGVALGDIDLHLETREDKTSGRRTNHPTQAYMWGDNGRQGETRPREGGHTIQHRHTCGGTMGDKGRQDPVKGDTPSNTKADTLRKH